MGRGTGRERKRDLSPEFNPNDFSRKKNRTGEKLIQPFPALHSRHVRPTLFSRFSFRLRSIFISFRNSPRDRSNILRPLVIFFFPSRSPPFRPLHYSSERHRFLPSKILLGRSCYLVSSSHFVILEPRFPTLSTIGGTIFESGIIVEQRTFCALSRLSVVEGVWRNIEEFFSSPLFFPPCYSWIFLPSECLLFEYFKLFEVLYRREGREWRGRGEYNHGDNVFSHFCNFLKFSRTQSYGGKSWSALKF